MPYLSDQFGERLAITVTVMELTSRVLLIVGLSIRCASIGTGLLLLSVGVSMAVSPSIYARLDYSIFTAAASAFLLAVLPNYKWSVNETLVKKKAESVSMMLLN